MSVSASTSERRAPAWLTPGRSRLLVTLLVLLVYVAAAVYYSWPLAEDFDGTIYGSVGDLTGAMASMREMLQQHQVPFLPGTLHDFNAPDGVHVNWALNLAILPSYGMIWVLALLFGPTAAYGIYTLLGWVASAFAMYLLVRKVTRSEPAAFIAGYAFGFYPFPILNGQGHNDFVHGWPLVLLIWRMLELREAPTRRNGILAGLAATLALAWTPYYLLIAGVVFATLLVVTLAVGAVRSRPELGTTLRACAWSVAPPVIYVVVIGLLSRSDTQGQGVRTHSIQELITYSARWYEYVVPSAQNPIFGDDTGPWLVKHLHGSNYSESTLYIGVSCILLAAAGLALVLKRAGHPRDWPRSPLALTAITAAVVAIVAFVWSAPPQVGVAGHLIPTPSDFVFKVTSTFRAYSRFVVAVMAGVTLLAGVGIGAILRGRSRPVALVLAVLLGGVVITDTWARIHPATNKLGTPAIYKVLKKQPPGIVAEYPLEPAGYGVYAALHYQQAHGHPIINGYSEGTPEEARALALQHLNDPNTPAGLAKLGVKYVLLTTQPVSAPGADPGTPVQQGLKLIGEDPYAKLYRVTAKPPLADVAYGRGFSVLEGAGTQSWRWMDQPDATLTVRATCDGCRGVLRFGTASFGTPRRLVVRDQGGKVLARVKVKTGPIGEQPVRIPLRLSRRMNLTLHVDPGPQGANNGDPRDLAIAVRYPTVSRK